ncbi:MAG: hypothetical protein Ct9H300mP28_25170 [Pseudomonadota bacterium]|nr:MAG: hypothetical protein Ct9H300mP28_25170 [Pseudomonadota bacterium]
MLLRILLLSKCPRNFFFRKKGYIHSDWVIPRSESSLKSQAGFLIIPGCSILTLFAIKVAAASAQADEEDSTVPHPLSPKLWDRPLQPDVAKPRTDFHKAGRLLYSTQALAVINNSNCKCRSKFNQKKCRLHY